MALMCDCNLIAPMQHIIVLYMYICISMIFIFYYFCCALLTFIYMAAGLGLMFLHLWS